MNADQPPFLLCASAALTNGKHRKYLLTFEGRAEECLLVRFDGKAYAYINRCVHMPRTLDCQKDLVFDHTGRYLRCSMHGIVYTPETGTSVSTMCEGDQLRAIELREENGQIMLTDFRISSAQSV